jgi:hypothetical protein
MFRFDRIATVKNVADMPAAVQFAAHVTSYLKKTHSLNMSYGVELFGTPSIHWYMEIDSLDKANQLNATLLQDRGYAEILDKARALWADGSVKDTIVSLAA